MKSFLIYDSFRLARVLILKYLQGVMKDNISELWTCVKVTQWMERCGKLTQNNAHRVGAVCFLASVELCFFSFYSFLLKFTFLDTVKIIE